MLSGPFGPDWEHYSSLWYSAHPPSPLQSLRSQIVLYDSHSHRHQMRMMTKRSHYPHHQMTSVCLLWLSWSAQLTSDGKSCCSVKAQQYIEKGKKNNANYCAVLFENAACHSCKRLASGWDEGIQQGKRTFPKFDLAGNSRFREDSESVIVAPGCIFVGYDESEP